MLESNSDQINLVAQIAEQEDQKIVEVLNAQAKHMQSLTLLIMSMHKKVFPEKYDWKGNLLPERENNANVGKNIVLVPPHK